MTTPTPPPTTPASDALSRMHTGIAREVTSFAISDKKLTDCIDAIVGHANTYFTIAGILPEKSAHLPAPTDTKPALAPTGSSKPQDGAKCPECMGKCYCYDVAYPGGWLCGYCDGTGLAPFLEAKPPLASVDAALNDPTDLSQPEELPSVPSIATNSSLPPKPDRVCPECNGECFVIVEPPGVLDEIPCPACSGTGLAPTPAPTKNLPTETSLVAAPDAGPTPTPTPRTDAAIRMSLYQAAVPPAFARQLETELAEARAELARKTNEIENLRKPMIAQLRDRAITAEQELAEWKRNAHEYSQEAKDELDKRLAAEQEAERLDLKINSVCVELAKEQQEAERLRGQVAALKLTVGNLAGKFFPETSALHALLAQAGCESVRKGDMEALRAGRDALAKQVAALEESTEYWKQQWNHQTAGLDTLREQLAELKGQKL